MTTALVGLVAGLAVSVGAWVYFDTLALFLFLPFVPFLLAGREDDRDRQRVRTCPECGFRTEDREYEYCPRDGTRLRELE
ncbi:hypothetical protein ACYJ1Y_11610 [Natrialbaceae archaeon A-gly3]